MLLIILETACLKIEVLRHGDNQDTRRLISSALKTWELPATRPRTDANPTNLSRILFMVRMDSICHPKRISYRVELDGILHRAPSRASIPGTGRQEPESKPRLTG